MSWWPWRKQSATQSEPEPAQEADDDFHDVDFPGRVLVATPFAGAVATMLRSGWNAEAIVWTLQQLEATQSATEARVRAEMSAKASARTGRTSADSSTDRKRTRWRNQKRRQREKLRGLQGGAERSGGSMSQPPSYPPDVPLR